ncbi:hypothetical protein CLAFUW4_00413 [Fulvia fulva]|nr:hypothetical protein CLAFUR4_00413 [Fulvia fulva]KAK4638347.1 hypothetical protein CLAFUR0_00414 [Fulvia fulva]WPV09895.1 hypothetical protein CLAFUW4_00413 [Fulvia fulva]WPV23272.1 hypothetical protein CLAFUW7_00417 [Fulvia fulva]
MLRVLRQRALCHPPISWTAVRSPARLSCAIRNGYPHVGRRPGSPITRTGQLGRSQSSVGKTPAEVFKYPEWLNVYRLSSAATLCVGFTRVCTLVVFGVGAIIYAPAIAFSPHHSNCLIPACIVASAVPMVAVIFTSGPSVMSIRVQLPPHARRSREGLLKFANNLPPRTILRLESMKLIPWPTQTDVVFADLTRHRPSWKGGLSNLENTPVTTQGNEREGTFFAQLIRRLLGRYYVQRDQKKDRSSAPGLWEKMWEQIPEHNITPGNVRTRRMVSKSAKPLTKLEPLPPVRRIKSKNKP